jgi:hypothetical protein
LLSTDPFVLDDYKLVLTVVRSESLAIWLYNHFVDPSLRRDELETGKVVNA